MNQLNYPCFLDRVQEEPLHCWPSWTVAAALVHDSAGSRGVYSASHIRSEQDQTRYFLLKHHRLSTELSSCSREDSLGRFVKLMGIRGLRPF